MSMTISSSVGSHHGEALKPQLPAVGAELKDGTLKITVPESLANLNLVVSALKSTETEHPELKRIELDFSPMLQEAQRSPEQALAHISPILCRLVKWKGKNSELIVQISGLSEALQRNGAIRNFANHLEFQDPVCPDSPLKDNSFRLPKAKSSSLSPRVNDTFTLQFENEKLVLSFNTSPIAPSHISGVISAISKFDQDLVIDLSERELAGWECAIALTQIGHRCKRDAGKLSILVKTDSPTDALLQRLSASKHNAKYLGEIIRI